MAIEAAPATPVSREALMLQNSGLPAARLKPAMQRNTKAGTGLWTTALASIATAESRYTAAR